MAGMGNGERDNAERLFVGTAWHDSVARLGVNGTLDAALEARPDYEWTCEQHGHTFVGGLTECVVCDHLPANRLLEAA